MKINRNKKTYRNDIDRNIPLNYWFTFFMNLDMSVSVWVLYLAFRGMTLWQIGVLEGVYHVTSMICEIPSGAIADLLGRKRTVVWGRLCTACSCILMLFSQNFPGFALAFVVQALGNNLNSGSEEALVYDSMKQCGREEEYLKVNGRINLLVEISQSIATVAGGVLAEYSYFWCYGASALIAVVALAPAALMKEPEAVKEPGNERMAEEKGNGILRHFKICGSILAGGREIRSVLLYFSMVFAFHTVLFFYSQQYFFDSGLNKVEISMIMLFGGAASCLGALGSEKLFEKMGNAAQYAAAFLLAACIAGFGFQKLWLSVLLFMASCFANSLLYPIQSISLNRLIPSEQRATLISVSSMLFSVVMVLLFPAAGAAADRIGLPKTFFFLGILLLAGTGAFLQREKNAGKP